MPSLLEIMRKQTPQFFKVDRRRIKTVIPDVVFSCKTCIVKEKRAPEHCDPCSSNPDAARLKRVGLL